MDEQEQRESHDILLLLIIITSLWHAMRSVSSSRSVHCVWFAVHRVIGRYLSLYKVRWPVAWRRRCASDGAVGHVTLNVCYLSAVAGNASMFTTNCVSACLCLYRAQPHGISTVFNVKQHTACNWQTGVRCLGDYTCHVGYLVRWNTKRHHERTALPWRPYPSRMQFNPK